MKKIGRNDRTRNQYLTFDVPIAPLLFLSPNPNATQVQLCRARMDRKGLAHAVLEFHGDAHANVVGAESHHTVLSAPWYDSHMS
jgi:hypothetical protein